MYNEKWLRLKRILKKREKNTCYSNPYWLGLVLETNNLYTALLYSQNFNCFQSYQETFQNSSTGIKMTLFFPYVFCCFLFTKDAHTILGISNKETVPWYNLKWSFSPLAYIKIRLASYICLITLRLEGQHLWK